MCIAVGNVSFEDWDILTSSFGANVFSPSPTILPSIWWALLEITSFIFMFVWVPEPVCQITKGNWLSWSPLIISSQTLLISSFFDLVKTPKSKFVKAAAFFRIAKAWIISIGIEPGLPILKLFIDRWVWGPHNACFSTFTSPIVSFSIL